MKSIVEVLRQKEADLQQIQKDIEVLHQAVRLLSEDGDPQVLAPTGTSADTRLKDISTGNARPRQFP